MSSKSKNVDRLSNLPEEILSQILSLMPTNFAVRTSVLSKRWRYIWTLVTKLDVNDYHPTYGFSSFSTFVDRVLELCKTPQIKSLRLALFRLPVKKLDVSKWLNEAVRLNVCELDVSVRLFEPPVSLFTCKTLTKLRLNVGFDYSDIDSSPVILPALKTLNITFPRKTFLKAFRLIRGCPVLESLYLVIRFRCDEEDYRFNIPTLKRLEITMNNCISSNNKVFLNLPNLEYLFVGGILRSLYVMEDLSSLVEATVSLSTSKESFDGLNAELLKGISGATSLSWSSLSVDVPLKLLLLKFSNLNRLELKGSFQSSWLLVFQELESSSKLQHSCFQEPEESCWIEPQLIPPWMLTNLRTMKIIRCKGRDCDIRFIKYMLRNSEVLKTLTITCESLHMKDEMRLCARLLTFPRASRYCRIHFAGKWLNSTGIS